MTARSDLHEFRVIVHHMTDRSVQVSEDGDLSNAVWFLLSQVELSPGPMIDGARWHDIIVPEQVAIKKGLLSS